MKRLMTCFWDGIIRALSERDKEILGFCPIQKVTPQSLLKQLKMKNRLADCRWNNQTLETKQLQEHFEAVKNYEETNLSSGHLTAACDSFLLLLCSVLSTRIVHDFNGNKFVFEPNKSFEVASAWNFRSSSTHFQFVSKS